MKTRIYYDYVNLNYLQKIICLGDVFGVPIRNIDARTREQQPRRIYFTNGRKRQGFIDERKNDHLSEKYFELYSPLGKIKGVFCHEMDPSIHFSVSVLQKPYDKITGFYNASFPKASSDNDISQVMRCSLKKNEKLAQTIDFHSGLEIKQCYTNSPLPYERLFIHRSGMSEFTLLHAKDFDKTNRSLAIQSQITKKDSTIHILQPVDVMVECEQKEKAYSFDYTNLELDKVYDILSQYDDGIGPCLDHFHQLLTFPNLDLYQNMVSACFPSMDQHTVTLLTGVETKSYQKNLALVSRLNAQKR